MIINESSLGAVFTGFKTNFNTGFAGAATYYKSVAMIVASLSRDETYGWLNQQSGLREWLGPRIVKNLSDSGYSIKNRKFEDTISVPRTDIEDDKYGVFAPFITDMGRAAAEHPDKLVAEVLAAGFATECYDGQFFFDTDHPVGDGEEIPVTSVSNLQTGAGAAWYLLDVSRAVKPVVYQERIAPLFTRLDRDNDENVFMEDEYMYGVRARSNAGYGLWQLAFASKAELTAANYESARAAMMAFKGDGGRPLGVLSGAAKPILLVPPSLEGAGMRLINNGSRIETVAEGDSVALQNEWAGTAQLVVSPWLS